MKLLMKRLLSLLALLAWAVPALAQTPEEILSRMEAELTRHENDGVIMTVDVKIPLLGTMTTKSWMLGDKMRMDARMLGVDIITWSDGKTKWTYNSKSKEVEIENEDPNNPTSSDGDTEMFEGITDDFDVTIKKETEEAWHFLCKKSKNNKDEDIPKKMDLVVSKANYFPVSLSATMSGMKITMRDISFGVTEKQVSFDIKDYPDAKIVDKR